MRLICVFYAFLNERLTREARGGAEEGRKQGGRVCESLFVAVTLRLELSRRN